MTSGRVSRKAAKECSPPRKPWTAMRDGQPARRGEREERYRHRLTTHSKIDNTTLTTPDAAPKTTSSLPNSIALSSEKPGSPYFNPVTTYASDNCCTYK